MSSAAEGRKEVRNDGGKKKGLFLLTPSLPPSSVRPVKEPLLAHLYDDDDDDAASLGFDRGARLSFYTHCEMKRGLRDSA